MSKSRSVLARELSSAVRESQGTSRAIWRKDKIPVWWPVEVPVVSTKVLTPEKMRTALASYAASKKQAIQNVTPDSEPTAFTLPKQESQLKRRLHEKDEQTELTAESELANESNLENDAEVKHEHIRQDASSDCDYETHLEHQNAHSNNEQVQQDDDCERKIEIQVERDAHVTDLQIRQETECENTIESKSQIQRASVVEHSDENATDPNNVDIPKQSEFKQIENVLQSGSQRNEVQVDNQSPANVLTERSQNVTSLFPKHHSSRPPRPPTKDKSSKASQGKRKMMVEAAIEEAERITQQSIEELRIDVEQRKQRLHTALRLKCDDIRSLAKLTLQKMPKEIRAMNVKEYIFKFGGDEQNVMIQEIEDRVKGHMLLSEFHDNVITQSPSFTSHTTDDNSTPTRATDYRTKTRRAAAVLAATTTRRMLAPTVAPPYTLRRSRRANMEGTIAEPTPAQTVRRSRRTAVKAFVQDENLTPRGGIRKTTSSKTSRGSDALLAFTGGAPTDSIVLKSRDNSTNGEKKQMISTPAKGEDVVAEVARDVEDETTLIAKLEAAAAETARARKVEAEIRKRLAQTQRKHKTARTRVR